MSNRKPVIGIAAQYEEKEHRLFLVESYEQAVLLSGGVPVILPLHAGRKELLYLLRWCDGFLLPGGPDVSPFLFDEETQEGCGRILPERDALECMLVCEILTNPMHREKPLLGICRGIQVMNVAMGGSLYQDILEWRKKYPERENIAHGQTARSDVPTHTVLLESRKMEYIPDMFAKKDDWLMEQLGVTQLKTNSFHHQLIKKTAPGFAVCGTTKDGAIEAIHKEGHPFCLGVQWHPEDLFYAKEQRRIFELLIEKASN